MVGVFDVWSCDRASVVFELEAVSLDPAADDTCLAVEFAGRR
jgi:hypothetical protein